MQRGGTYEVLSRIASSLDVVRAKLFGFSARTAALRAFVIHKDVRINTLCLGQAALAGAAALFCPSLLLVLGPLVLGVPHVASDVRYLVLRRPGPRAFGYAVVGFSVALLCLRLIETAYLGDPRFAGVELALVTLWLWVSASLAAPGPRRTWALVGTLVLGYVALGEPTLARVIFAHAHNLVAIVVWYALFRPRRASSLLPLACILLGAGALFWFGGTVPERFGLPECFDLHIEAAARWLAPGVASEHQLGLVLSYAFLQSVHYAIWLFLLPLDAHPSRGSATFSMSLQSAWRDFRGWGLGFIALGVVTVSVAAVLDPLTTSAVYLFVTPFHGYLELAVLAAWLATPSRAIATEGTPAGCRALSN